MIVWDGAPSYSDSIMIVLILITVVYNIPHVPGMVALAPSSSPPRIVARAVSSHAGQRGQRAPRADAVPALERLRLQDGNAMRGVKHEFGMLFTHQGRLTTTFETQTPKAGSSKYWETGRGPGRASSVSTVVENPSAVLAECSGISYLRRNMVVSMW